RRVVFLPAGVPLPSLQGESPDPPGQAPDLRSPAHTERFAPPRSSILPERLVPESRDLRKRSIDRIRGRLPPRESYATRAHCRECQIYKEISWWDSVPCA